MPMRFTRRSPMPIIRLTLSCALSCALLASLGQHAIAQSVFSQKKTDTIVVPLQDVPPALRETVRQVVEKPSIAARCNPRTFPADLDAYRFFLDHPDRAAQAWRRRGATCLTIQDRGNGFFGYSDENGSDVVWQTVVNQPNVRVWFAEGKVKPSTVLPIVPVKAVVVLRTTEVVYTDGTTGIQHHTEIAIHTDSKTAQVVTKMLGPSSQRIAQNGLEQFQYFFGGLAEYLSENPTRAAALMEK